MQPKGLDPQLSQLHTARSAAIATAIDGFYRSLSNVGRLSPRAQAARRGVTIVPDVEYRTAGHPLHRLDVYVPRQLPAPRPAVLYLHGGGFRILSKDTHWALALAFARHGFVVFNANYRLAPDDPFPAALDDAAAAFRWVVDNARRYGADPGRLVIAGESAGANLTSALTLCTCFERPEPFAKAVFDTGVVPRAALPACGILQVSEPERFLRNEALMPIVADRILAVCRGYLPHPQPGRHDLADPLVVLESDAVPARPLPPFLAIVGERDPIADDTHRLGAALNARGCDVEIRAYPKQGHAFHAYFWRPEARRAWRDTFSFLDRYL